MKPHPDQPAPWAKDLRARLQAVGWPDLGDCDLWLWWFARNLSILDDHGWFDLIRTESGSASEELGIAETILALRWIAEDAHDVSDGYAEYEPYWHDWLTALSIPTHSPYPAATAMAGWKAIRQEIEDEYIPFPNRQDYDNDEDYRAEIDNYDDITLGPLTIQSILMVCTRKRKAIATLLFKGWGDANRFYQGLSGVMFGGERDLYADDQDEDEEVPPADSPQAFEQLLTRLQGMRVNEMAEEAFDLGDAPGEKLGMYEWVHEHMPPRVQGSPQYMGCPAS